MANSNNNLDKKLRESLASRGLTVINAPNKERKTNKRQHTLNKIRKIERELGLHQW